MSRHLARSALLGAVASALFVMFASTADAIADRPDSPPDGTPSVIGTTPPPVLLPIVGHWYGCGVNRTVIAIPEAVANSPPFVTEGPPNPLLAVTELAVTLAGWPSLHDQTTYTRENGGRIASAWRALADGTQPACAFLPAGLCGSGGTFDNLVTFVEGFVHHDMLNTFTRVPDGPTRWMNGEHHPEHMIGPVEDGAPDIVATRFVVDVPRSDVERDVLPAIPEATIAQLEQIFGPITRIPNATPDPDADPDTEQLSASLYRRRDAAPDPTGRPIFIYLHGGGGAPFGPHRAVRLQAYAAARAGFDAIVFNTRGEGISDGTTVDSNETPRDIRRVIEALANAATRTLEDADGAGPVERALRPDALGAPLVLLGVSRGGWELTALLADERALPPDERLNVRGVVLIASGFSGYYNSSNMPGVNPLFSFRHDMYGFRDFDESAELIAATAHVPRVLFIAATNDYIFSLQGIVDGANAVRARGGSAIIRAIEGDHATALEPHRLDRTIEWSTRFARTAAFEDGPIEPEEPTTVDREVCRAMSGKSAEPD